MEERVVDQIGVNVLPGEPALADANGLAPVPTLPRLDHGPSAVPAPQALGFRESTATTPVAATYNKGR